jgi:hypothetical protein
MDSVIHTVANRTYTKAADWDYIDGPYTGVGIEYWLRNNKTGEEVYYCDDNGYVIVEVQNGID